MPSTYTNLGVQKMATGEKAGTWGTLTNTNWDIIEQISGAYTTQAITDNTTTALSKNDGTTGATLATRVWKLTGTLSSGNAGLTVPDAAVGFWIVNNAVTMATFTVSIGTVSNTGGVVWLAGDNSTKLIYNDGTNCIDMGSAFSLTSPAIGTGINDVKGNELIKVTATASAINELTIANAASGAGPTISATGGGTDVDINITPKAAGKIALDGIKWPNADGTADQVMTTDGSGVLSFVDNTGGTDWQAVVTGATLSAVAGNGYFIDTTSNACNVTLPGGTLGDEVTLVDYAATFDTNNLTVTPDTGEKIQGQSADTTLTCAVERAGFTLAYSGATQGWLLKDK